MHRLQFSIRSELEWASLVKVRGLSIAADLRVHLYKVTIALGRLRSTLFVHRVIVVEGEVRINLVMNLGPFPQGRLSIGKTFHEVLFLKDTIEHSSQTILDRRYCDGLFGYRDRHLDGNDHPRWAQSLRQDGVTSCWNREWENCLARE